VEITAKKKGRSLNPMVGGMSLITSGRTDVMFKIRFKMGQSDFSLLNCEFTVINTEFQIRYRPLKLKLECINLKHILNC